MDTSDIQLEQIAPDTKEEASNILDKLLDSHISSENIETTCDTNKNCDSCIILPNTIRRELSSQNENISGYTFRNHFTICNSNLETNLNEAEMSGGSLYRTTNRVTKKRRFRRNTRGGGNCMSNGTCEDKYNSNETPKTVADKPEMISLDGIMIIIIDLHGGLKMPAQPMTADSVAITNLASIAAAPPGLANVSLPGYTRQVHETYIARDLRNSMEDLIQQNFQDNLQKIEDIAAAADSDDKPKSNAEKKMSLVSPDLCVLMLDNLRQSVKESNAESFASWQNVNTIDRYTRAALDNPDERYRSLHIVKGFGVDPRLARSLPYTKYVAYHDKNDKMEKMGVTTMAFNVNKKNKVTTSKSFISADVLMPLIKYDERPDPDGGTLYSATMEDLITYFIGKAKKAPETIVLMDLTCSICSDKRLLAKPLPDYTRRIVQGGSNKKSKLKTKKNKTKQNKTKNRH